MRKPLPQLGALIGGHYLSERGALGAANQAPSDPKAISWLPAVCMALAICAALGAISLFVPPFINADSAFGFLAWRGTLLGAANSVISPDPSNIAHDSPWFLVFLSPGQYLVPGAISLLGLPLGIAMTLTVGVSLALSLIGWIMVVRTFSSRPSLALPVAVLIGLFHYSTHAFSTYHGGEILLQAATPWLFLAAYRIPQLDALSAALLAAGAVFIAFFAKLTGLIVVLAAFAASGLVFLKFRRRITHGMIGGALGTGVALAIVYVAYLSRGGTAVSETKWSLPFDGVTFAAIVPWVAGVSWADLMGVIHLIITKTYLMTFAYLVYSILPALLIAGLVLYWRPQTDDEQKFKLFCLWFYGIVAVIFMILFIHGALIELDERHFRSVGTLLFVCALMSALAAGAPLWARGLFFVLCGTMAFYGLASFSYHEITTAKAQTLDRVSWTNQRGFDFAAVNFLRKAYAQERRDALFVLPSYPIAVTLPIEARIIVLDLNWEPEARIAGRYTGRVPGHIFVLAPNSISDPRNGPPQLSAFRDYALDAWKKKTFTNMSVYFQ